MACLFMHLLPDFKQRNRERRVFCLRPCVRANVRHDLPEVCQLDKPRRILVNAIQLRGDELQHHVRFAGNAHSCPPNSDHLQFFRKLHI